MDIYPQTPKPVVQYRCDKEFYIKMGEPALVFPVDHKSDLVTNKKHVLTSPVMQFNPIEGGFETMNTVYVPYKGE